MQVPASYPSIAAAEVGYLQHNPLHQNNCLNDVTLCKCAPSTRLLHAYRLLTIYQLARLQGWHLQRCLWQLKLFPSLPCWRILHRDRSRERGTSHAEADSKVQVHQRSAMGTEIQLEGMVMSVHVVGTHDILTEIRRCVDRVRQGQRQRRCVMLQLASDN